MGRDYSGFVACSSRDNHNIASSRDAPHISSEGCSPAQKAGRCGWQNTLQRSSSSSWTQGTPAGLPCGMPGNGEVIEGAMQQAAQWGRQVIMQIRKGNKETELPVYFQKVID
jgi:hypothetical protein